MSYMMPYFRNFASLFAQVRHNLLCFDAKTDNNDSKFYKGAYYIEFAYVHPSWEASRTGVG